MKMNILPTVLFAFFILLFSNLVFAQDPSSETIFTEIWDALRTLGNKISQMIDDIQALNNGLNALVNNYILFKNDVNSSITNLHAKDADLENQISEMSMNIERDQLYEVINMNPNENTAYCNDNNDILLFGYCAGTFFGEGPTSSIIFFDAFTDYEYASNPPWSIQSGAMVVGAPVGNPSDGDFVCISGSACEASAPAPVFTNGITFESMIYSQQSGDEFFVGITDNPGILGQSLDSGYFLRAFVTSGGTTLSFNRLDSSSTTQLALISNIPVATGSEFIIKAERDGSGLWQLSVGGNLVGSPFVDSTYSNFTNIHVRFDGAQNFDGGRFDLIKISTSDVNFGSSALLNVNDVNSPMGIQCQLNGRARALCLQQD